MPNDCYINHFSRVLIIGETFHKKSGGGITLTNLFSKWPKENLAVVSTHKTIIKTDENFNIKLYRLGEDEISPRFPLNVLQQSYSSGKYIIRASDTSTIEVRGQLNFKDYLKRFVDKIFSAFGLYFLLSRTHPSKKLYDFISEFNPDIIYTQLSTLELIKFVYAIKKDLNIPLAIHIMDDWPEYLPDKCIIFKKYWKKLIDKEFRKILEEAKFLFAISEGMAREYHQRYGKEFIPFHNPVDLAKWLPFSKSNWEINTPCKVLYTGRIGLANSNSLYSICKAIDYIYQEHHIDLFLDIYTPNYADRNAKYITNRFKRVRVFPPVSHESMPNLLSSVDLLILPLDFDKKSIRFARLSMPTKASEYMISGTPTTVFVDKATFLSEHATRYCWAVVINKNDYKALAQKILDLYNNEDLRKKIGVNAKNFALKNYDKVKITKEFYTQLMRYN